MANEYKAPVLVHCSMLRDVLRTKRPPSALAERWRLSPVHFTNAVISHALTLETGRDYPTVAALRRHKHELLYLMGEDDDAVYDYESACAQDALEIRRAKKRAPRAKGAINPDMVREILISGASLNSMAKTLKIYPTQAHRIFTRTIERAAGITVSGVKDARAHKDEICDKMGFDLPTYKVEVRDRERHNHLEELLISAPKGQTVAVILCREQDAKLLKDLAAKWIREDDE